MKEVEKIRITRISGGKKQEVDDLLLWEESFRLVVNGQEVGDLNCLPRDIEQLVAGHCYCRGFYTAVEQIKRLEIDEEAKRIYFDVDVQPVTAKKIPATVQFTESEVHRLNDEFNKGCRLYHMTGAAHSCALADKNGIQVYMEDVARHNSLDKVIGEMLLKNISPHDKAFIFSGRLALDMLSKVTFSGVTLLIAPGAPTLSAVQLADANGITLCGFVRRDNINIYTHPDRVVLDQ